MGGKENMNEEINGLVQKCLIFFSCPTPASPALQPLIT